MKTLSIMLILAGTVLGMEHTASAQVSNIKPTSNKKHTMSTSEQNKTIVRTIYEQALNKRNFGMLNDLISENFTGIRGMKGPAAFEEPVAGVVKAMPDAQWHIETLLAEADKVFIWWKVKGTNTGPFQGLEPTGNAVVNDGVAIFQIADGKVVASQVLTDRLNFLQQLDVLPTDINALYQLKAGR